MRISASPAPYLSGWARSLPAPAAAPAAADARRLFVEHPGWTYGDLSEGVPRLTLLDGFLGRTLIERARQSLADRPARLEQLLSGMQRAAPDALAEALGRVVRHVAALREASAALAGEEPYRLGSARTSDGGDLAIRATATDGVGTPPAALKVLSLARAQEVASASRPDAGAALGLRGRFTLGSVEVPVLATDDLHALAARITWGEDANRNGRLDGSEDRNFSLTLEPHEDADGDGRLDTAEDLDGDGVLDAGEDLDGNGRLGVNEDLDHDFRLSGGTAAHGVEARVLEGRLILKRRDAGPVGIEATDPDGILASLGIVEVGYLGDQVFSRPIASPAGSRVEKDGREVALDANVTSDLVPGVTLEFRREAGPLTVSVSADTSRAVAAARRFVLEYNGVVRELNALLDDGGVAALEPRVQRFRRGLERAAQDPLDASPPPAAGLSPVALRDEGFSELQIRGVLDRLRSGLDGVFDHAHGVPSAAGHLSQMGIATLEDDTLALDEAALASALRRDGGSVARLLGDPIEGIAARTAAALDAATDSRVGSLPRFEAALRGRTLVPAARGIQDFQKAQRLGELTRLIAVA